MRDAKGQLFHAYSVRDISTHIQYAELANLVLKKKP